MNKIIVFMLGISIISLHAMEFPGSINNKRKTEEQSCSFEKKVKTTGIFEHISSIISTWLGAPKRALPQDTQETQETAAKKTKIEKTEPINEHKRKRISKSENESGPISSVCMKLSDHALSYFIGRLAIDCNKHSARWKTLLYVLTDHLIVSPQGYIYDKQTGNLLYTIPAGDLLCDTEQLLLYSPCQKRMWDISKLEFLYLYLSEYLSAEQASLLNYWYQQTIELKNNIQLNEFQKGILATIDPAIQQIINAYCE